MSQQQQQQQNPLIPILVETQAAAVDSQKKLLAHYENQIRQLSEALQNVGAQRDAYKKQVESLNAELLSRKNEEKDNVPEETSTVEVADE